MPTIVLTVAGAVLADRLPRSRILFLANLLSAAAQGMLAVLVATHHATTASIAACGLASGVAVAFTAPAAVGVVGQLVAAEHLQQANALVRLPNNAVKVLGPVVGGLIVAVGGPAWALSWEATATSAAGRRRSHGRCPAGCHEQRKSTRNLRIGSTALPSSSKTDQGAAPAPSTTRPQRGRQINWMSRNAASNSVALLRRTDAQQVTVGPGR
ncbi:MFS transporter [Streptomyces atratus]